MLDAHDPQLRNCWLKSGKNNTSKHQMIYPNWGVHCKFKEAKQIKTVGGTTFEFLLPEEAAKKMRELGW
jgi:hypothetical protein